MKNKFLLAMALFLTTAAQVQAQTIPTQPTKDTGVVPTVLIDSSMYSAYVSNPEELKGLTTETLRPEHAFPVLGSYTPSDAAAGEVTITLDETNKGIVWINGLPQGKFKALMKKAPATYKIPAQKTESGKSVSEGTLFFNPISKELTIVLGRPFNDADPTAALTNPTKKKSKVWQYTGVKIPVTTVVTPASEQ